MLIEEVSDGISMGYTENYIYTYIDGEYEVGSILKVELKETFKDGIKAEILKQGE